MIVTIDEVKTHLRIQHSEEDDYLSGLIAQAQAAAEDYCRAQFPEEAPEPVRLAVLLFIGFYYENRDVPDQQTYNTMRTAFQNLLYDTATTQYTVQWTWCWREEVTPDVP